MSFASNLKYLRKRHRLTQEELSQKLGIGRGRLAKYEEERAEPPLGLLRDIAEFFRVSLDGLLRKELEREKGQREQEKSSEKGREVEVIPGEATAGYLSGYGDPEYLEQLEKVRIPFLPSGELRIFPVRGDSMPPLEDGAYVIGRYIQDPSRIRDGRTYVVVSRNEGISYKRVWREIQDNGSLLLVPDNKLYRPYRLGVEEVLELWEYLGHLSFSGRT